MAITRKNKECVKNVWNGSPPCSRLKKYMFDTGSRRDCAAQEKLLELRGYDTLLGRNKVTRGNNSGQGGECMLRRQSR